MTELIFRCWKCNGEVTAKVGHRDLCPHCMTQFTVLEQQPGEDGYIILSEDYKA